MSESIDPHPNLIDTHAGASAQSRAGSGRLIIESLRDAHENGSLGALKTAFDTVALYSYPTHRLGRNWREAALRDAVQGGYVDSIEYLLKEQSVSTAHLDVRSLYPNSSLRTIKLLQQYGWDMNALDRRGFAAVHVLIDHEEIVRWLVEHGAKVDYSGGDDSGHPEKEQPLLELCAEIGNVALFEHLLNKGAPIGERTLHRAVFTASCRGIDPAEPAQSSEHSMLRYLVDDLKLDVNKCAILKIESRQLPNTPMTWVLGPPINTAAFCPEGDKVVAWLLGKGADPNLVHPEDSQALGLPRETALRYARKRPDGGHVDVSESILETWVHPITGQRAREERL